MGRPGWSHVASIFPRPGRRRTPDIPIDPSLDSSIFDKTVRDGRRVEVHESLTTQGFADRRFILRIEFENAVFSPHLSKSGAATA